MGYFNFYFLKKILSNKKIRKILFFIIIFIFVLFLKNNIFAVSFEYDNISYNLPDFPEQLISYEHKLIFINTSTKTNFAYYASNSPFYVTGVSSTSYSYAVGSGNSFKYCNYNSSTEKFSSVSSGTNAFSYSVSGHMMPAYCTETLSYEKNGETIILVQGAETYNEYPHFLNDEESISIGGQSLVIMPGDFPDTKEIRFCIQSVTETDNIISYHNLFEPISLTSSSDYYVGESSGFYYSIPWFFILSHIDIGNRYNYVLAYEVSNTTLRTEVEVLYGGSTPEDAIYNSQINQTNKINEQTQAINNQTNAINNQTQTIEQQTNAINNQTQTIEEQTGAIQDINSTMSDSSINTSSNDLPSINVNDPTQGGINNIFQLMYNAFCVGDPQDIVFPFPYTNKQIVLPVNYLRNNLQNSGSSWIISFIQAFWGYLFGGYVVYDITEKMNKIKEGNIEDLEKSNIKEEML